MLSPPSSDAPSQESAARCYIRVREKKKRKEAIHTYSDFDCYLF